MFGLFYLMFGLFQSIAGCLGVEANSERVFLCSGRISDPSMKPKTLSKYSFIAFNLHLEPSMKEIKEAYAQAYKSLKPTEEVSNNHVGQRLYTGESLKLTGSEPIESIIVITESCH
jgi:hypothetical protein